MKYKYKEKQKVKVISPSVHPAFNQIGTIISINEKHIICFYFVQFEDGKKYYFQEKELQKM